MHGDSELQPAPQAAAPRAASADGARFPAVEVAISRRPGCEDLPLPVPATAGSAGVDLRAAIDAPVTVVPGGITAVATGLSIALPPGYEGQVRPRSGLAARFGLTVVNAPGTIDSDYRGEIAVLLTVLGQDAVEIARGDRIAQLVIAPCVQPRWIERHSLEETSRGAGGFGSTGGHASVGEDGASQAATEEARS